MSQYKRQRRSRSPSDSDHDSSGSDRSPSPPYRLRRRTAKVESRALADMRLARTARGTLVGQVAGGVDNFVAVSAALAPGFGRAHYTRDNPFRHEPRSLRVHGDDDSCSSSSSAKFVILDSDDDGAATSDSDCDGDSVSEFVVADAAPLVPDVAAPSDAELDRADADVDGDSDDDDTASSDASATSLDRFLLAMRADRGLDQRERFVSALYYAVRCALDGAYHGRLARGVSDALSVERMVLQGRAVQQVWDAPGWRASRLAHSEAWVPGLADTLDCCPAWCCKPLPRTDDAYGGVCDACHRQRSVATVRLTLCGVPHGEKPAPLNTQYRHYAEWEQLASDGGASLDGDTPIVELPRVITLNLGADCRARILDYLRLRHMWLRLAVLCANDLRSLALPPKATARRILDGHEPALVNECLGEYHDTVELADAARRSWSAPSALHRV